MESPVEVERIMASPLAKRLARLVGFDLNGVTGSGPHGRIVKRDIEAAIATGQAGAPKAARGAIAVARAGVAFPAALSDGKILALYDKGTYEIVPHDKMRRIIAERLTLAKQTIPHYYLSIDCRLDELLRARERMNAAALHDGPRAYKLSVNDFIIKAMALALQQVPQANATWTEAGMLRHKYSDVGVAVAVDGGLFTFLILEKIQGRPLSGKAQVAWQIVGLALIASVFLLVTYGDIHRMFLQ